jgi:hypothetical protein
MKVRVRLGGGEECAKEIINEHFEDGQGCRGHKRCQV